MNVIVLLLPAPLFCALFDQQGSRWVDQAIDMNGDIGFYTILPDQMQLLNPLLVLVITPLFDYWFYPLLSKCGIQRPLQRMTIGGFLAAFSFVISAFLQWQIEFARPDKLHILWQVPQLVVITVGEIMFSISGLAFSYEQAPKSMKSIMQAVWLLTSAIGNAIVVIIEKLHFFETSTYEYIMYSVLMTLDILIFMVLAFRFRGVKTTEPKQQLTKRQ